MLFRRHAVASTLCSQGFVQLRSTSTREISGKRRTRNRLSEVDDLFDARSTFKRKSRAAEIEGTQLAESPATKRRSSRPVTFLDLPKAVAATDDTTAVTREQADALLPSEDPAFAVLTDDAETYFPPAAEQQQAQRLASAPGANTVAPGLRRYRLDLQFRGDHFLGWDRAAEMRRRVESAAPASDNATWANSSADGLRSARDAINEALAVALDLPNIRVHAGVVTETGVHARRLACHVDIPAEIEMMPRTIMLRASAWLRDKGDPLGILAMQRAAPDFDATKSLTQRVYVYRILNRIAPPLFDVGQHWHVDRRLDESAMAAAAAEMLVGTRDFGRFADKRVARMLRRDPNASVRTLTDLRVVRQEDEVLLWFVGQSFLRHSIRGMVGALKLVGQGLWSADTLRLVMEKGFSPSKKASHRTAPVAPAHGLTLWECQYPAAMGDTPDFVDSGPLEAATESNASPDDVGEGSVANPVRGSD